MYIFYSLCILFLPFISRAYCLLKNRKESSLILLVGIISVFSLIYSPFLSLEILKYNVDLCLSWTLFSLIIFFIFFFLIKYTLSYIKENSISQYKDLLKYLFLSSLIPFVLCFVFFLSTLFVQYEFNDQLAYTNLSSYYRENIFSFNGYTHLDRYYIITSGYYVNSALGFNNILQMYTVVWEVIPVIVTLYGCNDFLIVWYKQKEYKKYFLSTSFLLFMILIFSYSFFWAYASGNTLLQASVVFLLIYFLKMYKNLSFTFLTTIFLIYFSPTGILLSVGILIASFLYVIVFKNVKSWFYWLAYLLFLLGPILSIYLKNDFEIYLSFSLISCFYFTFISLLFNHYQFKFLKFNFINIYDNITSGKKKYKNSILNWIFNRFNLNFLFISSMLFFTVMLFVLFETYSNNQFIVLVLNIISLLINLALLVVMAYKIIRHNEYNHVLFFIYFLIIACFISSILIDHFFPTNNSTWRISYLSIGFGVPIYYVGIFAITAYTTLADKLLKLFKNKEVENNKKNKNKFVSFLFYRFNRTKIISSVSILFAIGFAYDSLAIPTYPLSLSSNINNAKTYFNSQEINELNAISKNISVNTNIITDAPVISYLQTGRNSDIYLLNDVNKITNYFNHFDWETENPAIDAWKLSMYTFDNSILQCYLNYYNPLNLNKSSEFNKMYNETNNQSIKNFMNNTFYGDNYISNFEAIITNANKNNSTAVSYFIFRSNSSYFNSYMANNSLFDYLINHLCYKMVFTNTHLDYNNVKINTNQQYLYILER